MQKLVQKHDEKIKLKLTLKLFEESIKSEETRRVYRVYFKKYMDYLEESNLLLLEPYPKKIEQSIIDYIILLKKNKGYSAIHNYISAILAFYKINDIVLNIDKINRFMPDKRKANKDRRYKHEEIGKLLEVADERMRAIILLLSSSGMRIGAIPSLRLRNLEKISIDKSMSVIYKITVYENDNEEHFTFCTPECVKTIDQYLEILY
jgi:site-specific recombinase XerD